MLNMILAVIGGILVAYAVLHGIATVRLSRAADRLGGGNHPQVLSFIGVRLLYGLAVLIVGLLLIAL